MKKILVFYIILISLVVSGCSSIKSIAESNINRQLFNIRDIQSGVIIMTDNETGVQYIKCYSSSGLSIIPRYNSDGTLYIDK